MEKKITGMVITGVAATVLLGLLLYRIMLIFSFNGEVGGIDNNFVYDVTRAIAGMDIYTDPASPPYAVTLYSPLYFTICSAIGKAIHISPDDPIQVYQLCRTISLFCDIITCILLGLILNNRLSVSKEYTWLLVAAFACILCLLGYTFSRADSLLLAFYAFTIFVLTLPLPHIFKAFLLAALSVCCIFSKQNGIIIPLLVLVWVVLRKEGRIVLWYVLFFIILGYQSLATCTHVYPHFFSNVITALNNRIDFSWFYVDIFKRMMNSLWVLPLYIAAVWSVYQWMKRNRDKEVQGPWAAIFIIQILFSLGTSLKWGSTAGYFNESLLLAFIIIGWLTKVPLEPKRSILRKTTFAFLPLLLLFFVHTVAQGYLFFLQNRTGKKTLYEHQKQVRDYLQPQLGDNYVLNLATPNSDFFKTLFYKNIAVPNMDMVDCCLLPDKTFDYTPMKEDLEIGKIRYLLLNEGGEPGRLWGVSLGEFMQDTTINGYTIYRR